MPTTCAEVTELLTSIRAAGWRRVGIDGVDGVGKTHLATTLSGLLGWAMIDIDDYLHKNQGSYVAFVDTNRLGAALNSHSSFILSGVCLRAVAARLGISIDGHIYVKRMRHGLWADEGECVFPDGLEVALQKHLSDLEIVSRYLGSPDSAGDQPRLTQEIMGYHDVHRPHELANVIYERVDHAG